MPHQITTHPDHTVEITASLDAAAVAEEKDVIARRFRRQAKVPGFRPGKAPLAAVRTRYAEEIQDELTESLAGRLWQKVLDEEEAFEPLSQPTFDEVTFDDDGGFQFKAHLEVRPHFELSDFEGFELPEVVLDVSEAEVGEEVERIREGQAIWEPAADDAVLADGLLAEVDMKGHIVGSDEPPHSEENARIVVGADGLPHELSEALQGAKVGDERVAERSVESGEGAEPQTHRYEMTVKAIKTKQLPAVDDALAQTVGLESLEELRERINQGLGHQKRSDRRDRWRRAALDHLEQGLDPETLPPSLVREAVNSDLQRYAYQLAMTGQTPDENLNVQALAAQFEPAARKRVLDTLVLEQLGDEWEVEVPESDVNDYIAAEAREKGIPPGEHRANLVKENRLDRLRHAARMAAIVSELLRRAGAEEDE